MPTPSRGSAGGRSSPSWEAPRIRSLLISLIGAQRFTPDWLAGESTCSWKLFHDCGETPWDSCGVGLLCLAAWPAVPPRSPTAMAVRLVAHTKIKSGDCIKVKGKIEEDAESFALNLGQDESELILHFNPRFESQGDVRTIVCNSKTCGEWGAELRDSEFPFHQGEDVKLFVSFDAQEVTVKMPRDHELKFPNRLEVETVGFFSIVGDLRIKCVKFD